MIPAAKRRNWLAEGLIPMRGSDTRTRKIVCYRRVGIAGGEPEVVGNSCLSDSMATPQIYVIILRLRDLTLLARRRNNGWQLTGTALGVQRVIVGVMLIAHSQKNIRIPECMFCLERNDVPLLIDIAEGGDNLTC